MQYRELGNTGKKVSVLGFGIMRMPYTMSEPRVIDRKKANEMIEYAYAHGVNYFDTAQNYLRGESESVLGEAVKGFRNKIHIATKVGIWHLKESIKDVEELFHSQLERLQTDYIDFYMIHALTDERWKTFRDFGIIDFFERKKREGFIRHYGFSYHGTAQFFQQILQEYDWEFVQLQFNYVDGDLQAGEAGLVRADQLGKGTIIMEPLRGGQLITDLPQSMTEILQQVNPDRTMADWGLNWLWNRQDVDIVLSGMNNLEQVQENIRLASLATPGMMSATELQALQAVQKIYESLVKVKCTQCRYCLLCPAKIGIPWIFAAYNSAFITSLERGKKLFLDEEYEDNCVNCGQCEARCPQDIKIRQVLQEIAEFFAKNALRK